MTLDINYKHEEWKYSPKGLLNFNSAASPSKLDIDQIFIGLGHNESQIQAQSLQDLQEAGYIEITEHTSYDLPFSNYRQRANMSAVLDDFKKEHGFLKIKFIKSPPASLWANANILKMPVLIELAPELNLNFILSITDAQPPIPAVIDFTLGKKSELNYGIHLQTNDSVYLQSNLSLNEASKAQTFSLLRGSAKYQRLEINKFLCGTETSCILNGSSLTKNDSVFDFHSNIFLTNKNQYGKQIYKSLSEDKSKNIFGGRIHICENASETQTEQLNNNLLLGKKSSVDTQPELNIFHDNVKAAHGATTSSIDEEQLFYFLSRGLDPEKSKALLLNAFVTSPLTDISQKTINDYFYKNILEGLK